MRRERGWTALAPTLLAVALLVAPGVRAAEEHLVEVKDPLVRVQAELDLFVNGARGGTTVVVIERGDVLALPADLERAGLPLRGGARSTVDGRELVSLRSLGPGITFELDERALALRITVPPELLGRHVLDLRPRLRPAEIEERVDPSAFLDYALDSDLTGHVGLAFEAGGRAGPWLATTGVSRPMLERRWVRGLTSAVRDDVPRLERWTVGDTFAASGALGGSALLGGVSFGREFSLDPYFVSGPLPATTAIISAPSTMEVYVNGGLVRQQALSPGYWDLTNLPATAGQTQLRTVIRDAFGRERTLESGLYFSSGLLAPGLTDFGVAGGLLREGFGAESFRYGGPAAVGRYRVGLSDWLTPGLRAEASGDVVSGGFSATAGSRWGEVEGVVAASVAQGDPGAAAQLSWRWLAPWYSAGVRLTTQSDRYAHLSLAPGADRPVLGADVSAGVTVLRGLGLGIDLRAGRYRDLGPSATAGVRGSAHVGRGVSIALSADYGRLVGDQAGVQVLAFVTWGRQGYGADAGVSRDRDGRVVRGVSATKALALDTGVGWRVHGAEADGVERLEGTLQGQTSFGRAELQVGRVGGTTSYRANASGGLVFIDRSLHLARATDGGYALVRAEGLKDVGVTVENGLVGRTGSDGTLLVTNLQPYYGTRLALRELDVPDLYEPGRTVRWIAAPPRGGAIVAFDLRRISAISGQLAVQIGGRDERPGNGELSAIVDGELRTSPLTEDGRFFLERMPPGKHVVQAVWRKGSCRAVVTLPPSAPPVWDAGELRCILDALDASGKIPSLRDPGYAEPPLSGTPDIRAGSGGE